MKTKLYEFAGKIVGKCLYESALGGSYRQLVKAKFTRSFLAQIIGLRVNYKVSDKCVWRISGLQGREGMSIIGSFGSARCSSSSLVSEAIVLLVAWVGIVRVTTWFLLMYPVLPHVSQ